MSTELSIIPILKPDERTYMALMSKNIDVSKEQLEATILNEMYNLDYIAQLYKPEILECEPMTISNGFRFVINNNLSFDQSLGLVHITTRRHTMKVRTGKDKDAKPIEREVRVLEVKPTVNGLVSMCKQAGTLINILPSDFEYDEKRYLKSVTINIQLPEYDSDGSLLKTKTVSKKFDLDFFKKLEIASHRQNSRGKADKTNNKTLNQANALYSSYYPDAQGFKPQDYSDKGGIDPEFANTKAIRHYLEKLDKNPNAKIKKGTFHSNVFKEDKDEIIDGTYDEVKKEPCQQCGNDDYLVDDMCESCRKPKAPKEDKEESKPNENIENDKVVSIIREMASLKTSTEVRNLYIKNKDFADSVSGMKDNMLSRFYELDKLEKQQPKPTTETKSKTINSDDL